jgi:nitrogen-specific signal transduction histidine kinase
MNDKQKKEKDITNTRIINVSPNDDSAIIGTNIIQVAKQKIQDESNNPELADKIEKALQMLRHSSSEYLKSSVDAGEKHYKIEILKDKSGELKIVYRNRTEEHLQNLALKDQIRIAQNEEWRRERTSMLMHEQRNLTTGLIGLLGLLSEQYNFEQNEVGLVDDVVEECGKMENLFQSYLDVGRASDYQLRKTSAVKAIDTVVRLCERDYQKLGISIEKKYAENLPDILGNNELLFSLWINLLKNSKDAIVEKKEKAGHMIIETKDMGSSGVKVAIRDNGIGMTQDVLDKWKNPDSEIIQSKKEVGSGYGMLVVKDVIKQHHAGYSIDSKIGAGAIFSIYLKKA